MPRLSDRCVNWKQFLKRKKKERCCPEDSIKLQFWAQGYLPPVFAKLVYLINKNTLLDLIQRHCCGAQLWVPTPDSGQVQHTLCEGQHQVQVAQCVCVLSLADEKETGCSKFHHKSIHQQTSPRPAHQCWSRFPDWNKKMKKRIIFHPWPKGPIISPPLIPILETTVGIEDCLLEAIVVC